MSGSRALINLVMLGSIVLGVLLGILVFAALGG